MAKYEGRAHDHPLYGTWSAMKTRCNNPNFKHYKYYGGRGITYHPSFETFEGFLDGLPDGYAPGLTLDRIDNEGNYEPGNLRWATRIEQMNNTRKNDLHTLGSEVRRSTSEIAREYGIGPSTLAARLKLGYTIEEAVAKKRHSKRFDTDSFIGNRYGKLVVLEYVDIVKGDKRFLCQCDCGNTNVVRLGAMSRGRTTSCGCVLRESTRARMAGVSPALRGFTDDEIREIKNATHSMAPKDVATWYNIPLPTVYSLMQGRIHRDLDY